MVSYPKDVLVSLYDPLKRFYHVVAELRNEPGALANVSSILSNSRINILEGFFSFPESEDRMVWSFFAEPKGRSLTSDRLEAKIKTSPYVTLCSVRKSEDGFIADSVDFPLRWNRGPRSVLIRQQVLSNMFKEMRETFGTGGEVIIYRQGFLIGKETCDFAKETFGRRFVREHSERVYSIYSAVGWGITEFVDLDSTNFRATIRIRDSFECIGQSSEKPYSQFVRGNLCGFVSTLFGAEMKCEEARCVAKGDLHCEFSLSKAWSLKEEML